MGNCKNCAFWFVRETNNGVAWGVCARLWDEDVRNSMAHVSPGDHAESDGELVTSGEFGCILWTVKPNAG